MLHDLAPVLARLKTQGHEEGIRILPQNSMILAGFVQVLAYKEGRLNDSRLLNACTACKTAQTCTSYMQTVDSLTHALESL